LVGLGGACIVGRCYLLNADFVLPVCVSVHKPMRVYMRYQSAEYGQGHAAAHSNYRKCWGDVQTKTASMGRVQANTGSIGRCAGKNSEHWAMCRQEQSIQTNQQASTPVVLSERVHRIAGLVNGDEAKVQLRKIDNTPVSASMHTHPQHAQRPLYPHRATTSPFAHVCSRLQFFFLILYQRVSSHKSVYYAGRTDSGRMTKFAPENSPILPNFSLELSLFEFRFTVFFYESPPFSFFKPRKEKPPKRPGANT